MNVLITSASRKVSLVKAFLKALAAEDGGKVIAADISPRAAALYVADEYILVPRSDDPSFVDTLLNCCKKHEVALVIPTRDEELPLFAHHRNRFSDEGIRVMVSSEAVIEICQHKKRFIGFCMAEGFSVARYYEEEADISDEDFPIFVRAVRGKGSVGAWAVHSRSELDSIIRGGGEFLVQEFIDAPEFTIDLFADFSGRVISVVVRQREFVFGGESFIGRTVWKSEILQDAVRLSERLVLVGHNTLQCFLSDDGIKWIEINPRYGGGANLGFEAGAPTPQYLIKTVKGEVVPSTIGAYEVGVTMLRYTQDLFLRDDDQAMF